MKKYRLAFVGTPKIALPSLTTLHNDQRFEIITVITQPDMPAGRNLELTPPPVKTLAETLGLSVFQPQKISQIIDQLREMQLDAMIVIAYAQIVPETILNLPKYGCINVHGSLLPKYRGAAVLQAPILNHDSETGVTIMLMDKTLDTGPILKQQAWPITDNETAGSLGEKMADIGAQILGDTLVDYFEGRIKPEAQNNELANYVGKLTKEDGLIDWTKPAKTLECFVRAMSPWPSAWTWLNGKKIKILAVDPHIISLNMHRPGKTFIYNSTLAIQCGTDALIIKQLQLEGKKAMAAEEFLKGYNDFIGKVLG